MKTNKLFATVMVAMMLLIVGCKKENQDKQKQFSLTPMQENVLHFDSFDVVYDYLNADQQDGFMSLRIAMQGLLMQEKFISSVM